MYRFILRRFLLLIPTVLAISIISFIIIQAPPGDFVDMYVAQTENLGELIEDDVVDALRARYALDRPLHVQYLRWLFGVLRGDLGRSLGLNRPVLDIILERLPWSLTISLLSLVFVYAVGIPIGVISATHQYSVRDYVVTFIGFIGLAIPNFLIALILLWVYYDATGKVAVGLFSREYQMAPWSFGRIIDLLKHVWMPMIIVGTAGTAGLIRIMRANLLDELQKPYVMVARAKGLSDSRVLYKYPFRIAINPVISTIGWTLPELVNGTLLTSLVLGIPTLAPVLLQALLSQDMFLAGSIIFVLSVLTVVGTLISDLLLAWLDPRIREAV